MKKQKSDQQGCLFEINIYSLSIQQSPSTLTGAQDTKTHNPDFTSFLRNSTLLPGIHDKTLCFVSSSSIHSEGSFASVAPLKCEAQMFLDTRFSSQAAFSSLRMHSLWMITFTYIASSRRFLLWTVKPLPPGHSEEPDSEKEGERWMFKLWILKKNTCGHFSFRGYHSYPW